MTLAFWVFAMVMADGDCITAPHGLDCPRSRAPCKCTPVPSICCVHIAGELCWHIRTRAKCKHDGNHTTNKLDPTGIVDTDLSSKRTTKTFESNYARRARSAHKTPNRYFKPEGRTNEEDMEID